MPALELILSTSDTKPALPSRNHLFQRTPWRAVSAMFAMNGALFGIWASRIPAISSQHGLTTASLGLLLLFMAAGAIVAFPIAGRITDKYGPAKVTRRTAIFYAGSLVLPAFAPEIWTLSIALFIFGAIHGTMDVAMNTWAAEVERGSEKPVMSSFHAMFSLGAGLGAITGYAAISFDLSLPVHFIVGSLFFAALGLFIANIPGSSELSPSKDQSPMFVLPKGKLLMVAMIAFCGAIGEGAMADWSAIFIVLVAHVDEARAALGFTAFSIAMVAMRLLGDRVTTAFGPVTTARFAGLTAATGLVIAVGFGTYEMILVGFILAGLGFAVIIPLVFTRAANDPYISPGAAIASVSTLGYGGLLLGPPLIGFVAEITDIQTAFLIMAALVVSIVLMAGVLGKT